MLLEGKNLFFRYNKGPWLIQDLNIAIENGEVVGLFGPSGCGKTTLARILAGYEIPSKGKVTIEDSSLPVYGYFPVQLVFQHPEKAVNPRWRMHQILSEAWLPDDNLLTAFGIEKNWLKRWPNELSGGELQRFCVIRALGLNTKFLIADEMTTMLDAITKAQTWNTVLEVARQRNIWVLVVSHDLSLLNCICSRIIEFPNIL